MAEAFLLATGMQELPVITETPNRVNEVEEIKWPLKSNSVHAQAYISRGQSSLPEN